MKTRKIAAFSLSNSTIQRIIEAMTTYFKNQFAQVIKTAAFGLFSIQPHESNDVASCFHLMVFVKYAHLIGFKEELLFCSRLKKNYESRRHLRKGFFFLWITKSFVEKPIWVLQRRSPSYVRNQIWISILRWKAKSRHKRRLLYDSSPCTGLQNFSSCITWSS